MTGSFTTAILYDRYHKKRAQQRWCNLVSHIAREPMAPKEMPRKITIFLAAPPGDSLRAAREHFLEYAKPVLVAGAMDWDVIEGRREGDVRAGLAEKIRKMRRKEGEKPVTSVEGEMPPEGEDLVQEFRNTVGIKEIEGVQGDLVLGRHTWKEYIRGLHEGWLGPLEPPSEHPQELASAVTNSPDEGKQAPGIASTSPSSDSTTGLENSPSTMNLDNPGTEPQKPETQEKKEEPKDSQGEQKPKEPSQRPSYISTSAYSSRILAPSTPGSLPASTVLPFPHLLGFLGTPVRIYRFLNRRYVADETGRQVAALVLASHVQNWKSEMDFASSADPDASPSSFDSVQTDSNTVGVVATRQRWEQECVLEQEERDWYKTAWQSRKDDGDRPWKEQMVIDPRIGERMMRFQLGEDEQNRVKKDSGIDPAAKGFWEGLKELVGWEKDTSVKGWEHGLVEGE